MFSLFDPEIPPKFSTDAAFMGLKKKCELAKRGTSRKVYIVPGDRYVLKVALSKKFTVCNWTEIAAFYAHDRDQDKLGRVISWSISGKFLVMEKLDMASEPSELFEFPTWANDRKPTNVGKAKDGTYKMCDFALVIPEDSVSPSQFA